MSLLQLLQADVDKDPGLQGNLLFSRLMKADLSLVSRRYTHMHTSGVCFFASLVSRAPTWNCLREPQVSKADYGKIGSDVLLERQRDKLESKGLKPYCIPVGGSNALGTWGYLMV